MSNEEININDLETPPVALGPEQASPVGSVATSGYDIQKPGIQDPFSLLGPEQHGRARVLVTAMAEKFGVSPDNFGVIQTEDEGKPTFTVAYNGVNGIDRGSWEDIFSKQAKDEFIVRIGKDKYDTRKGMTQGVYRAMVRQAVDSGTTLPDSGVSIVELAGISAPMGSRGRGKLLTTLLTGELWKSGSRVMQGLFREKITYAGEAQVGFVQYGQASIGKLSGTNRDIVRFRPAVTL